VRVLPVIGIRKNNSEASNIVLALENEEHPHTPARFWIEDRKRPAPELHAALQIGRVIYATSEGFAGNWDPLPKEQVVLIRYEGLPHLIKAAHSGKVRGLKKFADLSARPATYASHLQLQHDMRTLEDRFLEFQTGFVGLRGILEEVVPTLFKRGLVPSGTTLLSKLMLNPADPEFIAALQELNVAVTQFLEA
jgi:hypothetical protein